MTVLLAMKWIFPVTRGTIRTLWFVTLLLFLLLFLLLQIIVRILLKMHWVLPTLGIVLWLVLKGQTDSSLSHKDTKVVTFS